jgi:citrate synthase
MANNAELSFKNQNVSLPMRTATLGSDVIDIKTLGQSDVYTWDPGFNSTASCTSHITFIDGLKGQLLYRGYPIEQLAADCDYMEVCHLLIHGELPTIEQKNKFVTLVKHHYSVDDSIKNVFNSFRNDVHPMGMLLSTMAALSAFHQDSPDANQVEANELAALQLIAKISVLSAMCYKHTMNQPFTAPNPEMSYAENFLYMMFSKEGERPDPVLVQAMDRIFTLHADHEQNASTSTVRMTGSTGANPFASIAAGIAALWGPAHGGANEAALNMLNVIGDESQIPEYIKRAKDKNDPFRLMGFGHRVYKNYDPRAKIMRETCYNVLDAVGRHNEPLFKLALKLEKIALEDEYFVTRKLYPNVDFYSGITLNAMGIPSNMFTVIFALARTVGWISHWLEMIQDSEFRLARPRQLYQGPTERDVTAIEKR